MVCAFINHKGGVGKTMLAVNTAFYYKECLYRVLVADVDQQYNSFQLLSGFTWNYEDTIWTDETGLITVASEKEPDYIQKWYRNHFGDIIFDCPPSYGSANDLIKYLTSLGINVDVWFVPLDIRTSIEGAGTMVKIIRHAEPDSRIVIVGNRINSSEHTINDRTEIARFSDVEVYNQIIPQADDISLFQQQGGKPVWEFYGKTQFAIQVREFARWIRFGAKSLHTFKNVTDQEVDADRDIFIKTKVKARRKYGDYKQA